jgi:macrolide-specific efflux system membrane fusion protein
MRFPRASRPLFIYAAPLVLVLGLLWWTLLRTIETIETIPVTRADLESSVPALGTLQPHSYVDVGAQVSGQILHIAVAAGQRVEKNHLLMEIDPSIQQAKVDVDRAALDSLRAQLAQIQAQCDLARIEAARQHQLLEVDSTRLQDVQTADVNLRVETARIADLKAQIKGTESTLKGDETLLGYTRVYAPMAGTVVTLDAREGQTLNATYQTPTLLRLADLTHMTVWTEVSEADIGKLKVGMPVYFSTLAVQSEINPRRWISQVRQILPAPPRPDISSSTQTATTTANKVVLYTVLFDVDNSDGALMAQMSAQVFFVEASAKQALIAPLSALQPIEGKSDWFTARVLVDGKIKTREVHTGIRERLNAQVLSGLNTGDQLVIAVHRARAGAGLFQW